MYIMGINPTVAQTSGEGPAFKLGTLGAVAPGAAGYTSPMTDTGTTAGASISTRAFVYVSSAAGVTAGHAVLIDNDHDAVSASTTSGAAGTGGSNRVGVAQVDIEAGGFGWVQVYGPVAVNVLASTAIYSPVSLSATAGSLDDLVASGSIQVVGLSISAVDGTSATAHLNHPSLLPAVPA